MNQPTPTDLLLIATRMFGDEFSKANGERRRQLLADAFGAWRLARDVINETPLAGQESDELMPRLAVEADISSELKGTGEQAAESQSSNSRLVEAALALGYKETRGVRSMLELAQGAENAGVIGADTLHSSKGFGIVNWIKEMKEVSPLHFEILKKFKKERTKTGRIAGGREKGQKTNSAKSAVK